MSDPCSLVLWVPLTKKKELRPSSRKGQLSSQTNDLSKNNKVSINLSNLLLSRPILCDS